MNIYLNRYPTPILTVMTNIQKIMKRFKNGEGKSFIELGWNSYGVCRTISGRIVTEQLISHKKWWNLLYVYWWSKGHSSLYLQQSKLIKLISPFPLPPSLCLSLSQSFTVEWMSFIKTTVVLQASQRSPTQAQLNVIQQLATQTPFARTSICLFIVLNDSELI